MIKIFSDDVNEELNKRIQDKLETLKSESDAYRAVYLSGIEEGLQILSDILYDE